MTTLSAKAIFLFKEKVEDSLPYVLHFGLKACFLLLFTSIPERKRRRKRKKRKEAASDARCGTAAPRIGCPFGILLICLPIA